MKKIQYIFYVVLIAAVLGACFIPMEGKGNLTISWGNTSSRAFFESLDTLSSINVVITDTADNTIINETLNNSSSVSYTVEPGIWTITVKGYVKETLSVMGIEQVTVEAGKIATVELGLYTVTEVKNWRALNDAIGANDEVYAKSPGREELFILTGNFIASSTITIQRPIILISEDITVVERQFGNFIEPFFNITAPNASNAILTLGKPGMTGTITFDGQGSGESPLITIGKTGINTRGTLVLHNGVRLQNNQSYCGEESTAGGVYVNSTGIFTMYGGSIRLNEVIVSQGAREQKIYSGGGVCVAGRFIAYGGEIVNNNCFDNNAHAVLVKQDGFFSFAKGVKINNNDVLYE